MQFVSTKHTNMVGKSQKPHDFQGKQQWHRVVQINIGKGRKVFALGNPLFHHGFHRFRDCPGDRKQAPKHAWYFSFPQRRTPKQRYFSSREIAALPLSCGYNWVSCFLWTSHSPVTLSANLPLLCCLIIRGSFKCGERNCG